MSWPTWGPTSRLSPSGIRTLAVGADVDRSRVRYRAEGRQQESLDGFGWTLTPEQHEGGQAIAMDMGEPYIHSTRAHLDDAGDKIVFATFHIATHLHDAGDRVRRGAHRLCQQAGETRLAGPKYLWLMRPKEMPAEQCATVRTLQRTDRTVARAWLLTEQFQRFWAYPYHGAAQTLFARWVGRATPSRLRPLVQVAKLIQRHLPNVRASVPHGITNAGLEAINPTIQWGKKTARGFRNVDNFKTAISFHCGGLDLYPRKTG